MPKTRAKTPSSSTEVENLSINIRSFSRNYFIARSGSGDDAFTDDEAILDIDGIIERAEGRSGRHLEQPISVRLLSSKRYVKSEARDCHFFGSVTLRGRQRSALAYLPSEVFWELPFLLREGASVVQLTFERMTGGYGDLVSLYIGGPSDPLTALA
jgi:hypothetical protein